MKRRAMNIGKRRNQADECEETTRLIGASKRGKGSINICAGDGPNFATRFGAPLET